MVSNLATVAMDQGRLDDALAYALRALALTKEIDDPEGIATAFLHLGDVYRLTGSYADAREYLERGLEVGRNHGLHYFTAHLLCSLAALDLTEGRMEASIAHAAEAQEPARLADIPHAAARALLVAGMARAAVGDRTAVELLQEAAERYAMLGLQAEWLESRSVLAVAILESGDVEAALQIVREVLPGLHSGGTPGSVEPGRVLADVHRVLDAAGDIGAGDLARRAGAFLQERSTQIRDDRLRTGFLSTPVNVELVRIAASAPLG